MKTLFNVLMIFAVVGFMASCSSAPEGEKVKAEDEKEVNEEKKAESMTLAVNAEDSKIKWHGTKIGGEHKGTIGISSGTLNVKEGELVGGTIEFDMTDMTVTDEELPDEAKAKLVGHLSSGDFFEVEKFPTAKFEITGAKALEGDENGNTHEISGNLTMRDVTKNITFKAKVNLGDGSLTAEAPQFVINRYDWGVDWENPAKEAALNKEIGIAIDLKANATEG